MRNYPVVILSAVDTASINGAAYFVGAAGAASFISTFGDATAAGAVKIQASNDAPVGDPSQFVPTNWADIPNATSTIAVGVGPAIVLPTMTFQYIRAVYTRTGGGSTTFAVRMSALGIA